MKSFSLDTIYNKNGIMLEEIIKEILQSIIIENYLIEE